MPKEQFLDVSEKSAIPIYILGVYHLKELFESEKRTMQLHLTRRWIQSLVNHLMSHESFLIGLTNVKNFQEYTLNHSVNVCILSLALGRYLGMSRPALIELGVSACLHDVGKFEIPSEVLDKTGKFTPEDRAVMERHPHFGAGKLAERRKTEAIPLAAIQVALEHHIKPALGGYPKYVLRKQVSLCSKIVKVVDYYDAITTKRIYRPKTFTPEEALQLMQSEDEFDPLIFKAFASDDGRLPRGDARGLEQAAEVGVVIENNPLPFSDRPASSQTHRRCRGTEIRRAGRRPRGNGSSNEDVPADHRQDARRGKVPYPGHGCSDRPDSLTGFSGNRSEGRSSIGRRPGCPPGRRPLSEAPCGAGRPAAISRASSALRRSSPKPLRNPVLQNRIRYKARI